MELQHFSHVHPLFLGEVNVKGEQVACDGCQRPIVSPAYSCRDCEFLLHKACAELPEIISHPMHLDHPLTLLVKPPYAKGWCSCNVCNLRGWRHFTYSCLPCNFDADVFCAFDHLEELRLGQEERRYKHVSHEHPLMLQQKPALFLCDACGTKHEDLSFSCSTCPYWIQKSCALLRKFFNCEDDMHPLTLAFNLPIKYRSWRLSCDVCHVRLKANKWVYYCALCRYFTHVQCARPDLVKTESITSASKSETSAEVDQMKDLIQLTDGDSHLEIMTRFVKQHNLSEEVRNPKVINEFSHEHPLLLSDMGNEDMLCDACIKPVSAPHYSCDGCNYFLHLSCAELPRRVISHPLHPEHTISLCKPTKSFFITKCTICGRNSNGFFYKCEDNACNFYIDVKCASLPSSLAHAAHKHPLARCQASDEKCNGCGSRFTGFGLGCVACRYYLHYNCAQLPPSVRHRWDKHPLYVSYPPFSYHPDDFLCDICETEIHPKHWICHCRICDQSFHPFCIPLLERCLNIKFGGTLQNGNHEHPLTFNPSGDFRSYCNSCGDRLDNKMAFKCGFCKYFLCQPCACVITGVSPEKQYEFERPKKMITGSQDDNML